MPENLMCAEHKSNSDEYRKEWVRIFSSKGLPVKKVIFNKNDCAISKLFQPYIGVYRGVTFTERGEY